MTFSTLLKKTGLVLMCATLFACGFQPRKPKPLPPQLQQIAVSPAESRDPLQKQIRQELVFSGSKIVGREQASSELVVLAIRETDSPVAYGADGQVHRGRLKQQLHFKVIDRAGKEILTPQMIVVSQDYTNDPNDQLSSNEEKQTIRAEMRQQLAQQLMARLASI